MIFNHCERLKVTMHDCCCWPFTRQGTTPCCPKHFLLGGCKQSKHLIATKGDQEGKKGERELMPKKGQRVAPFLFVMLLKKWRDFFKRVVNRSSLLSENKIKKSSLNQKVFFRLNSDFFACKMTDKKGRRIEKKGKALKGFYTIWHLMVCRNVIFMRESHCNSSAFIHLVTMKKKQHEKPIENSLSRVNRNCIFLAAKY